MSFPEFWWAVDSSRIREEVAWKRTREVVAMLYNTNAKKNNQKKAKDLIPLSIDKPILKVVAKPDYQRFKKIVAERKLKFG